MFTFNCTGRLFVLNQPVVMGIINVTPDSFYEGSRKMDVDSFIEQAEKMTNEGAAILDVGGVSTRPGSRQATVEEELQRVVPAIKVIHDRFPNIFLSVDTYRSAVAKQAVEAGASFVNDISGGDLDEAMLATVAQLKVPYICMHTKGSPETMKELAVYDNVTREVLDHFILKLHACRNAGINDIIIDPGFGFAKSIEHNFTLLRQLEAFKILGRPVLAGLSRKSTIYKTLGITASEALNGTTVLNTIALMKGAHILRVHNVKEAVEAVKLVKSVVA